MYYSEHEAHHLLQRSIHINPTSTTASSSSPLAVPVRSLPLFALAKQLEDSLDKSALHATYSTDLGQFECTLEEATGAGVCTQVKHISADNGNNRVLGMVYRNFESLQR